MFQNWVQRDVSGFKGTRSSTDTQAIFEKLVGNGATNRSPKQTLW